MALNLVPVTGNTLAVTKEPIYNNWVTIDSAFEVDHVAYGAAGVGFHKKVTFPNQTSAAVSAASQVVLSAQGNELYMSKNAAAAFSFTRLFNTSEGATTLPSGIKMKWGIGTTAGTGLLDVTYNTSSVATFNTATRAVFLTPTIDSASAPSTVYYLTAYNASTTGFSVKASSAAQVRFSWFAIGI